MATTEKLELILTAKDQMSAVLKKLTTAFKSVDKESKNAFKSLDKFFKLSDKGAKFSFNKQFAADVRKLNAEAAKLKKTLESIGKIKPPKIEAPKIKLPKADAPSGSSNKRTPTSDEELDKVFNKKRRSKSTIDRLANINERILEPATEIKNVWKEQINSVRELTEETKKLYHAQAKFKLINLSEEENKKAFEAVTNVVRKFGTVTQTEGIETLTDLHTALGNLDHAIEALPNAAQYRFSMKTLFGDKFSDSQVEEQIQNAYKYLEVTGKVAKGKEEMDKAFNVLTQITNATGGRITPSEMLLMGRRAGASGRNLSDDGLRNLSAVIQEMGGDRTGTSLMSLYQALVGGKITQSAAAEFDRLGLIDKSKIEYGKAQKIKKIQPGANKLGDLMQTNPLNASDTLLEAMKKAGINTGDPKAISKELAVLFGNRNAQNLMDILINQRSQVTKESNLAASSQNNDQMYAGIDKNLKKLQEVENAWIDLKAKAGIPLIQMFGKLAEAATPVLNFFSEHETLTQWGLGALLVGKGLSGIAQTASILNQSGMLSFFRSATKRADVTSIALGNANTKANTLKNSLSGIGNRQFGIGVKVLAVAGLYEAIQYALDKAKEAGESQNRNFSDARKNYSEWTKTDDSLKTQKEIEFKANETWGVALNSGLGIAPQKGKEWDRLSTLEKSFNAIKQTYLYPVSKYYGAENKFTGFGFAHDKNTYAEGFRQTSPQLADPKIMTEFLKQMYARIPDTAERNTVREGLKLSYPDSYSQAVLKLGESTSGLSTSFAELSKPTGELTTSVQNAYNGMNNFASSANGIASRLSSLQIVAPSYSQFPVFSPNQNQSGSPFGLKKFSFGGGKAKGGSVTKNHTYQINEIGQEFFTPSASGSIVSNDALRSSASRRGANSASVVVNNKNTFIITGKNADEIADKVVKQLEILSAKVSKMESENTPDNLARKVSYSSRRNSELT